MKNPVPALFQLEFKSELDAEMVRPDGFDRAGDMGAQCLDGVHCGAESLGERAAYLVLRAVLAGLDIEPDAVENDLDLADIAIAHGSPLGRDNPRIGSLHSPVAAPA